MISLELDVHTHTVASGHYTRDTVTDFIRQAAESGLKLLGISDHGPAIPHSCTASYFRGLSGVYLLSEGGPKGRPPFSAPIITQRGESFQMEKAICQHCTKSAPPSWAYC